MERCSIPVLSDEKGKAPTANKKDLTARVALRFRLSRN